MRGVIHWAIVVVVLVHGLIHLLGAAKGFGWAQVSQLKEPISPAIGSIWLAAGALAVIAGVLLAAGVRWWWVVGAVALVASQTVIVTSWNDAKFGTIANIILLAAVVYGYASQGPTSYRAEYRQLAETAFSAPVADVPVTEADLASLPPQVAAYLRRCGVVGQSRVRVTNFRALIRGRIRAAGHSAWMTFTGEQVNTYGPEPADCSSWTPPCSASRWTSCTPTSAPPPPCASRLAHSYRW